MAVAQGYGKMAGTDALVFAYDTGDTINSYRGEPTTNLLPNGTAEVHDPGSGNTVTVTDATSEKGPGWKKVTITARGSNFRTLQWTYLDMLANIMYCFSADFDWGNMRDKGYFIYFDGSGTGVREYYRPGNYSTPASSVIDTTMPNGKFAGTIINTSPHLHSFFIGNYSTGVSGLNDYFYYKEFQPEIKTHPTQYTPGTRSATQGLLDLTRNRTININSVSFNSNAQIDFDGTDDVISIGNLGTIGTKYTIECIFNSTSVVNYRNVFDMNYATYSGVTGNVGPRLEQYSNGDLIWIWSGNTSTNNIYNYSTIGNISANIWYHTALTLDSGNVSMYLNGVLTATNASPNGYITTFGDVNLGRGFVLDPSRYYDGSLPIMKIYNTSLTAGEVQNNYQNYKTRFNLP